MRPNLMLSRASFGGGFGAPAPASFSAAAAAPDVQIVVPEKAAPDKVKVEDGVALMRQHIAGVVSKQLSRYFKVRCRSSKGLARHAWPPRRARRWGHHRAVPSLAFRRRSRGPGL